MPKDPLLLGAAAAAAVCALGWLLAAVSASRWKAKAAALAAEAAKPQSAEYRVERFDLLWYPSVSFEPAQKRVVGVTPGLPHCRACLVPLKSAGAEWVCSSCQKRHPESVADVMILDQVGRQALAYFEERHKGWSIQPTRKA